MSPIRRAARATVRLAAAGLMVIGGLSVGVEFMRHRMHGTEMRAGRCLLWCIPVFIGTILLFKSDAIARRLTEDFDDES